MHYVIHYSEIGLKGNNRGQFEKTLISNIQNKLKNNLKELKKISGKIIIETEKNAEDDLKRIPGIANYSECIKVKTEFNEIEKGALQIAKENKKKTFKVITTRTWKQFPKVSQEVNEKIGEYILKNTEMKVDVKTPKLKIYVEINKENTFIFAKKNKGIGGLPVGSAGKLISLISGGIDSPVASYMMMKRGGKVIFVHCMNGTLVTESAKAKVVDLVKELSKYQGKTKLYIVPFQDIQKEIIKTVPAKFRMIVYRRFMLRIANKIKYSEKAKAIITGDSLSQVASQTLENINAIRSVIQTPILSPLIGMNKDETIELAKKIGTYEISIQPYPDCCSFMIAKHPELRGDTKKIEKMEEELKVDELVTDAVKRAELINF